MKFKQTCDAQLGQGVCHGQSYKGSASLIALAVIGLAGLPTPAGAQDDVASSASQPAERASSRDIVVTATRQATNLQDTPIAITAVTAEDFEVRGLKSVTDLTSIVPNAQFRRPQGVYGPGVAASIRGIGQGDTNLGNDPAVAYYIDDIYYPILLGSNFDLLDIDHVEVLRGPQGTLFGRNSLGGAVNIVSKQPSFNETTAYVQLTAGSYNRTDVRAGFNVPLGENLAFMASGSFRKRQGYQRVLDFVCDMNRRGTPELAGTLPPYDLGLQSSAHFSSDDCTIGRLAGEDIAALRGSVAWEPADDVRLTITGDYVQDESPNAADTLLSTDTGLVNAREKAVFDYFGVIYDERFITDSPYTTYETFKDPIGSGVIIPNNSYYNGMPSHGGNIVNPTGRLVNWGISGKLEVALTSEIDLIAVAGYRSLVENHDYAKDGTPLSIEQITNDISNKYGTAELRLAGQMDWIDWVVGLFYFEAEGYQHSINDSPRNGTIRILNNTFDPVSKAVYANATLRPFDNADTALSGLSFTGGLRYSDDKKVVSLTNLLDNTPNPGDIAFDVTPQDKVVSWKAGLNYEVSPAMLLYASAATGYTLPGYNARPQQPTQIAQFDGNKDIAYELGAKLDLFDRRLRLNLAGFYTDFSTRPQSVSGQEILLDAAGGNTAGNNVVIPLVNGPEGATTCRLRTPEEVASGVQGFTCLGRVYYLNTPAEIWGFEAEANAEPVDGLLFNGAVGYHKFTSPDIEARTVNARQSEPFWQVNAGLQYTIEGAPLGGTITPRADWIWQSSTANGTLTTDWNEPAYSLVNARLTYRLDDQGFSAALGVTNLFDKLYYHNYFVYQDFRGSPPHRASGI